MISFQDNYKLQLGFFFHLVRNFDFDVFVIENYE